MVKEVLEDFNYYYFDTIALKEEIFTP